MLPQPSHLWTGTSLISYFLAPMETLALPGSGTFRLFHWDCSISFVSSLYSVPSFPEELWLILQPTFLFYEIEKVLINPSGRRLVVKLRREWTSCVRFSNVCRHPDASGNWEAHRHLKLLQVAVWSHDSRKSYMWARMCVEIKIPFIPDKSIRPIGRDFSHRSPDLKNA